MRQGEGLSIAPESGPSITQSLTQNPKIAIPRQPSSDAPPYGRRVPRACESCRHRKTKCSGDTPFCRQCRELSIACQYPVSWKEKTQQDLDHVSAKALDLEILVREIANIVDGRTSGRIRDVLEKHELSSRDPLMSVTPQDDVHGEDERSSSPSVGSLDAIDRVDEDLNRTEESRATGYMGKNSEVTWMQRLQREAEQRSQKRPGIYYPDFDSYGDRDFALPGVNYHLDDLDINVPGPVQTYWIPPRHLADRLFEDYLNTVHPFFPIISRPLFRAQYRNFYEEAGQPGDKWLAVLNMVFAISAKHAHLKQAPWRGDDKDHLEYLTRARVLSMDGNALFSHPDLQQIQVEGLIVFYLLSSDQINRAWRASALAVRSAITLGINLRSTSEATTNMSKEARYRVWWCLYSFEHILGIMTGRPTCILDGICTSPLPFPFEEENMQDPVSVRVLNNPDLRRELVECALASNYAREIPVNSTAGKEAKHSDEARNTTWLRHIPANEGLCFLYYIDLIVIAQAIVHKVYSLDCLTVPWAHIENRIGELRSNLDVWYTNLPDAFSFAQKSDDGPDMLRGKLFLAFHYYSARITLGRPCLCRRDARQKVANYMRTFSHEIAITTLESSCQMLDVIPDEPVATQLYDICPWWCILHFLMQATTVLLLELSFGSIHMPGEETRFLGAAKKGVRWLYAMSESSIAARRGWQLCDSNLRCIAKGFDYDVTDMPTFTYQPKPDHPTGFDSSYTPSMGPSTISATLGTTMPYTAAESTAPPSQFNLSELSGRPTVDLMSMSTDETGVYFPYDPITGEFMRSFCPASNEENPWAQHTWQ